jgi:hypothetical protein
MGERWQCGLAGGMLSTAFQENCYVKASLEAAGGVAQGK